jgi:hypothetical protein
LNFYTIRQIESCLGLAVDILRRIAVRLQFRPHFSVLLTSSILASDFKNTFSTNYIFRDSGVPGGGQLDVPGGDCVGDTTYDDRDDVQCNKDTTDCDDDTDCTLHGSLVHLRGLSGLVEPAEPVHDSILGAKRIASHGLRHKHAHCVTSSKILLIK